MTTFKLYFNEDDIRRVTLEVPDWDHFNASLIELYPTQFHPELRVCYKDEEGDLITISTQNEWNLMMEAEKGSVKKLFISEGKNTGKYFKDGPPPTPVGVYAVEDGTKKVVEEDEGIKKLEFTVPKCLERLFPGGKITPYSLPSWLQGCVEIKRLPGDTPVVDMDVNIGKLFDTLHSQALALIKPDSDPQLLKRAKDLLQALVDMVPENPLAHYNLACAESLLGEVKEAAKSLKRAVETGYSNLTHMLQDTDLLNLHSIPEFQEIVDMLREQIEPKGEKEEPVKEGEKEEPAKEDKEPVKVEVKEEERKEEPVKVEVVKEESVKVEVVKEEKKEEAVKVEVVKAEPAKEEKEPVKVEVEVKEKKEEAPKPSRWASQLEALAGMGFTNADVNSVLLDDYKGDLVKVVNALLYGSQQ